ncbi:MAG TPA: tripartite tricarboxylate transporter substrate binding protein [Hyphomicrobiaceae bacterium]|nr:tripartite tricarboxylate transporter substrate binding protein [Hyphomicrobiaceae bacterium]
MRRRTFLKIAGSAGVGISTFPAIVRAQAPWPNKPVKIIVPFGAGGGTDNLARFWAEKLGQAFGQQFVVENRGGASGMIGTEAVAKSAPDGYTLLLTSNSPTVNLPLLRKVPYDASSLLPVVRVGDAVTGFCVHPSTGLKSVKELVDYARANPGKLSCCSPGAGTSGHMRMEMLAYRAGVSFLHVPYRGGADALNDLLAGVVHFMNDPTCNPSARAGKLDMLCVNHTTRSPEFPDAPTLTEAGYPNSDVPLWFCIWAPAGLPKSIADALHAKVTEISKVPETTARLQLSGMLPVTSTQEEVPAFREAESRAMSELIKAANIKLE